MSAWEDVMALEKAGQVEQKGGANILSDDDVQTIMATIDFFGGDWRQDYQDLSSKAMANVNGVVVPFAPRYRVFDWLAMRVQGRHSGQPSEEVTTKVLVHSFMKSGGVPSKFIQDLRETDYYIDKSYEDIELGV